MTLDYGLEIECLLPAQNAGTPMTAQRLAELITAAGIPCREGNITTPLNGKWKVTHDGSLRPAVGQVGFEVVGPPLTETGLEQVEKVCATLQSLGGTVNKSCGLHVHVSARTLGVPVLKKLAELYLTHEPVIDTFVPGSRRLSANPYCASLARTNVRALAAARNVNEIAAAIGGGKYIKLNFTAFWEHGTVEFRHHSGTVDAAKIIKWVILVNALVATAVKEAGMPSLLVAPAGPTEYSRYWNRSRQLRQLHQLLTRLEGVTNEEYRAVLNRRSQPNIRFHLAASGEASRYGRAGRRNGRSVWKFLPPEAEVVATTPAPATLEGLYTRLELAAEDKTYWSARAASFTPTGQIRRDVAGHAAGHDLADAVA